MIDLTPFAKKIGKKPVYVVGLGKSGLSSVKALVKAGIQVLAWDDNEDSRAAAKRAKAEISSPEVVEFSGLACVVLSPGIPLTHPQPHPVVTKAQAHDVPVIGDMELFHLSKHGCKTVGITGTNGKSTTTALIGHVLNKCGVKAAVGGNIGEAVLGLSITEKTQAVVLELSSYQIDLCPTFRPDIGVLLNVTPDHIDRHGTIEGYAAVKAKIFDALNTAIVSIDDEYCRGTFHHLEKEGRTPIAISTEKEIEYGVYAEDGKLFDALKDGEVKDIGAFSAFPALSGVHNHQNAIAAYAVARQFDIAQDKIFEAMKSFPGLPHRQQVVATINGVAYINDSKATNADSTSKALATYHNLYWIVGGRSKDGGLDGLDKYMDRIRYAYLIGEAAESFADWLEKRGVTYRICRTLDKAIEEAHEQAQSDRGQPGGTGCVLLSPACASWDQFKNFEERGEAFINIVKDLSE